LIITVDFETYYDREYSLSKMTTEEYVRDDRFEVIGVCVKVDNDAPLWFSGSHNEITQWFKQFDWEHACVLAHNTMFDGAILAWRFGINPIAWLDTLAMARAIDGVEAGNSLAKLAQRYAIGQKGNEVVLAMGKHRADFTPTEMNNYGSYCVNDTHIAYELFKIFRKSFNASEFKLIDLTLRMFIQPALQLNLPLLEQHLEEVIERKRKLVEATQADREILMSNDKFAEALMALGVQPPTKISPTTKKTTYAFAKNDEAFKALSEHWDERVQALVAARLGTKSTLEETRTQRLIGIAKRGSLPVPLRYYAAHTGRWGGDDKLNLQNLPRKSLLKSSIVPPAGYVLIDSDSSQIEARILAWLAGQNDLVTAFQEGRDVYKIMAAKIYSKPIDEISDDERFVGKTTILGAGYGMGAIKFRAQLKAFGVDLSDDMCAHILRTYRSEFGRIPMLWEDANRCLDALADEQLKTFTFGKQAQAVSLLPGVGFDLPSGIPLKYTELKKSGEIMRDTVQYVYTTKRGLVRIYGGKVVENICQAVARCVIGEQMLRVSEKYRVVLTVHDAVACIAPENEADEAAAYVQTCMRWRPEWAKTLPLNCEVKVGDSYGTAKKWAGK